MLSGDVTLTADAPELPTAAVQPWTRVIWPHELDELGLTDGRVYDAFTAQRLPAVSKATATYSGLLKQCPIDTYRGTTPLPRPRLLDRPDPQRARSWFVHVQVEDYLWHGNALHLVVARDTTGHPSAVRWLPAAWCSIVTEPGRQVRYYTSAGELDPDDVVHVRRGADRRNPARGVGVIEQHLATYDRMALEEEYERRSLIGGGVPSVAVIANNPELSDDEAKAAKTAFVTAHAGPGREPAILPLGSTIVPLGWSPSDSQMIEARKMSLLDVANAFGLDGYWLGAPTTSLTYRSPGPLYLALLRTSLEGVLVDFEQGWGDVWLPYGQSLVFDRLALTRDDFASSVTTLAAGTAAGLFDVEEARQYLGLAPSDETTKLSPVDTVESTPPAAETADEEATE